MDKDVDSTNELLDLLTIEERTSRLRLEAAKVSAAEASAIGAGSAAAARHAAMNARERARESRDSDPPLRQHGTVMLCRSPSMKCLRSVSAVEGLSSWISLRYRQLAAE